MKDLNISCPELKCVQCYLVKNENPVFPHSSAVAMVIVPVVTGECCLGLKKTGQPSG